MEVFWRINILGGEHDQGLSYFVTQCQQNNDYIINYVFLKDRLSERTTSFVSNYHQNSPMHQSKNNIACYTIQMKMKMNSIRSKDLKNKRMLLALFFLTGCILLNMEKNSPHRRFQPSFYPPAQYGRELRALSQYLGNGECEWLAPEKIEEENPMNTTTLLVSYPGSGKRLSWRILEALTGKFHPCIIGFCFCL